MTKKVKDPTVKSRIINIAADDNKVLKRLFLDLEDTGCDKTRQEVVDDLFKIGLYEKAKTLRQNEES